MTDFDEIRKKIMNKEITICETCDSIFEYVPQKKYCNECCDKRKSVRSAKYFLRSEKNRKILRKKKRWDYVDGVWRKHKSNEYEEEEE
tara:strand:- start:85 stop:348 length:264 start_codon:yes stop_codon:yes gene_type:complete